MAEIVAELSQLARQSPHVNQHSGVSVRLSITNYETLRANAVRRALRLGESDAVPRVSDLGALVSSTQGKIEIEALEEGREERILQGLCRPRSWRCSAAAVPPSSSAAVVTAFDDSEVVHAGDDLPAVGLRASAGPGARARGPGRSPSRAGRPRAPWPRAAELILEGLHLTKRLNKEAAGSRATYRGRG